MTTDHLIAAEIAASTLPRARHEPFAVRQLSVLAYANGFTLWHYRSACSLAAVCAPGFFRDGTDMLNAGDVMMLNGSDGAGVGAVVPGGDVVLMRDARP